MAIEKLYEGLQTDDAEFMRKLVERNPALKQTLEAQNGLYDAFLSNDEDAIKNLKPEPPTRRGGGESTSRQSAREAAFSLDELNAEVDKRLEATFDARYKKSFTDSASDMEALAEKVAEKIMKKQTPDILAAAARTSDEIVKVRTSHAREFGEELNTEDFVKFYEGKEAAYGSLSKAHDAFVQDKRVTKAIADGVQEELKKQRSENQTPDTLHTPRADPRSPMSQFMADNAKRTNQTAAPRGEGLDAAARAFRELQSRNVN